MTRPLRVLLTGFEPFGGEPVNPAQLLVESFAAGDVPGVELRTALLPVDAGRVTDVLEAAIAAARPDAIVLLGQAAKRDAVCLETTACNRVAYGDEVDNAGRRVEDAPVVDGGPARLASTLPLEALERELADGGLPVRRSDDAGRYLCNHALYTTLHGHPTTPAAFVHVPLLPEQAERRARGEPGMPLDVMARCLRALLERLPSHLRPGDGAA